MSSEYKSFFKQKANVKSGNAPKPSKRGKSPSPRKAQRKRTSRSTSMPLIPVLFAGLGLSLGLWATFNVDEVEKWISAVEVGIFSEGVAQTNDGEEKAKTKESKEEKSAAAEKKNMPEKNMKRESWTPEEVALFKKLDARKQKLDLREEELNKLEGELQRQKKILEERMAELEETRRKIASQLKDRVEVDETRVNKLVDVYSNMKPSNAAKVFEKLDEDLAIEVLGNMKKKSAADILNLLSAEKAQRLSEKYAGYKRR